MLEQYTKTKINVDIKLTKKLPIASGMGGGSSNAATLLHCIIDLLKVKIKKDFNDFLFKIGADVPFCFYRKTAIVKGKGEKIKIKINGEYVDLSLIQEEMVYQWAKKKDAPKPGTAEKYVEDPVFQKNFISDFAKTFNGKFKNLKYTDVDLAARPEAMAMAIVTLVPTAILIVMA